MSANGRRLRPGLLERAGATDVGAGALSDRLGARAFTMGRDIAFSRGGVPAGEPGGTALIAHELAHVGQQGGVKGRPIADNSGASPSTTWRGP